MWRSLFFQSSNSNRGICIYLLPYVALVKEKAVELQLIGNELGYQVAPFYFGASQVNELEIDVAVCTIEKGSQLVQKYLTSKERIILTLVIDEFHVLFTPGRGEILENVIIKCLTTNARAQNVRKRKSEPGTIVGGSDEGNRSELDRIQLIGMSATFPQHGKLVRWLNATGFESHYRPIELKEYFVLEGRRAYAKECSELRPIDVETLDAVSLTVQPVIESDHPVLLFCHSRRGCEEYAVKLAEYINGRQPFPQSAELTRTLLLLRISALTSWGDQRAVLWDRVIPAKVGIHHSGLTNNERTIIENAYRAGVLKILTATSTLAAGVNLPAQRVVFNKPFLGRDFITTMDYRQMCGRAGRTGHGAIGESFLVCETEQELNKVLGVASAKIEASRSRTDDAWQRLILQTAALQVDGITSADLEDFVGLAATDADVSRLGGLTEELIELGHLVRADELIRVTELGLGCIDGSPYEGHLLWKEFRSAAWVPSSSAMLLYLLVPFDFTSLHELKGLIQEYRSLVATHGATAYETRRWLGKTSIESKVTKPQCFEWLLTHTCASTRWAFRAITHRCVDALKELCRDVRSWLPATADPKCSLVDSPGYRIIQYERLYVALICDYYLNSRGPLDQLVERLGVLVGDIESKSQSCLCNGAFVIKLATHLRWQSIQVTLTRFIASQYAVKRGSSSTPLNKLMPLINTPMLKVLAKHKIAKLKHLLNVNSLYLAYVVLFDLAAQEPSLVPPIFSALYKVTGGDPYALSHQLASQLIVMAAVSHKAYESWIRKHADIQSHEGAESALEMFSLSIRKKTESIWQATYEQTEMSAESSTGQQSLTPSPPLCRTTAKRRRSSITPLQRNKLLKMDEVIMKDELTEDLPMKQDEPSGISSIFNELESVGSLTGGSDIRTGRSGSAIFDDLLSPLHKTQTSRKDSSATSTDSSFLSLGSAASEFRDALHLPSVSQPMLHSLNVYNEQIDPEELYKVTCDPSKWLRLPHIAVNNESELVFKKLQLRIAAMGVRIRYSQQQMPCYKPLSVIAALDHLRCEASYVHVLVADGECLVLVDNVWSFAAQYRRKKLYPPPADITVNDALDMSAECTSVDTSVSWCPSSDSELFDDEREVNTPHGPALTPVANRKMPLDWLPLRSPECCCLRQLLLYKLKQRKAVFFYVGAVEGLQQLLKDGWVDRAILSAQWPQVYDLSVAVWQLSSDTSCNIDVVCRTKTEFIQHFLLPGASGEMLDLWVVALWVLTRLKLQDQLTHYVLVETPYIVALLLQQEAGIPYRPTPTLTCSSEDITERWTTERLLTLIDLTIACCVATTSKIRTRGQPGAPPVVRLPYTDVSACGKIVEVEILKHPPRTRVYKSNSKLLEKWSLESEDARRVCDAIKTCRSLHAIRLKILGLVESAQAVVNPAQTLPQQLRRSASDTSHRLLSRFHVLKSSTGRVGLTLVGAADHDLLCFERPKTISYPFSTTKCAECHQFLIRLKDVVLADAGKPGSFALCKTHREVFRSRFGDVRSLPLLALHADPRVKFCLLHGINASASAALITPLEATRKGYRLAENQCKALVEDVFLLPSTEGTGASTAPPCIQLTPRRFISTEGTEHWLLSLDYCQAELRILAHFSQDPMLLEIFAADGDPFRLIAAEWFRVDPAAVVQEQRDQAKLCVYSIIYGRSARAVLSELNSLTPEVTEGTERYDAFRSLFKTTFAFIDGLQRQVARDGFVRTIGSRRRYFPKLKHDRHDPRSLRQATSTLCQGSVADIVKSVVGRLTPLLEEWGGRHVFQVHDQFIIEFYARPSDVVIASVVEVCERSITLNNVTPKIKWSLNQHWV